MQNFTNFKALKNTKYLDYIKSYEDEPLPLNLGSGRQIIEIGFGNGELLTRMAKARSADFFIGIENSEISCIKTAKRAQNLGLKNLTIIHDDAKFIVREIFQKFSIDLILSVYPIPWPKNSQESHRIFSEDFLMAAISLLKSNGEFIIVTDDETYEMWIEENLKRLETDFTVRQIMPLNATKYGRKWKELGRTSWSISVKSRQFNVGRKVIGEVPHVHLKEVNFEKLNELSTKDFIYGENVIHFKGLFKGQDEYLLKVISVDGNFVQTYYIILKKQNDGWLAKLDEGIKVFKTPAVKMSIELTGKAALSDD